MLLLQWLAAGLPRCLHNTTPLLIYYHHHHHQEHLGLSMIPICLDSIKVSGHQQSPLNKDSHGHQTPHSSETVDMKPKVEAKTGGK